MVLEVGRVQDQESLQFPIGSDNGSKYYGPGVDDIRPEYYSGLEDGSDEDD